MKLNLIITSAVFICILFSASILAHDKVVVIPLADCPELPQCAQIIKNSKKMLFKLIPAGTFTMGSPSTEPGGPWPDETQHEVTLTKSFFMQVTEVTQSQWQAVIGNNPSQSNKGDDYPVEYVNWYEAVYFANELSSAEGFSDCYTLTGCTGNPGEGMNDCTVTIHHNCTGYRLPTEAEWEYAARATTKTAWPWLFSYDDSEAGNHTEAGFNPNLHAMGWYEFNKEGGNLNTDTPGYPTGTKPVAKKQPNKWGLFDIVGNVWEWVQDWNDLSYPTGPVTNPKGPSDGSYRALRGGCWYSPARQARSATRGRGSPDGRLSYLGFRLARTK